MRFKGKSLFLQTMKKGRNKELIKLRDEALYRRYYYWRRCSAYVLMMP